MKNDTASSMIGAFFCVMLILLLTPKCTESHWYRVMTGEDVYPVSTLTAQQWVEKDQKDTSYIHMCGRVPCKMPQK